MVDFKKMSEMYHDGTLIVPQGLSIETIDGQEVTLPQGTDVADLLGGSGGAPLPRITAGQPRDARYPDGSNQLYLIQSSMAVNESGERERIKQFIGPFGDKLQVRPVGFTLNRSNMPKYDPNATGDANKPLCRSENFTTPDAAYAGKYSTACARLDPKSGRLVAVCPAAQWGAKGENGKSMPPACAESYVLCVAFQHDDEWIVAECYFKSASAAAGKTLVQQLRGLQHKGLPMYAYPVELFMKEAGVGNTYAGRLVLPTLPGLGGPSSDDELMPAPDDLPALEEATQRWGEAKSMRAERAARVFVDADVDAANRDAEPSTADVMDGVAEAPAVAPKGNGKGKKAVKPMI